VDDRAEVHPAVQDVDANLPAATLTGQPAVTGLVVGAHVRDDGCDRPAGPAPVIDPRHRLSWC
jgi:hypothetical protein